MNTILRQKLINMNKTPRIFLSLLVDTFNDLYIFKWKTEDCKGKGFRANMVVDIVFLEADSFELLKKESNLTEVCSIDF